MPRSIDAEGAVADALAGMGWHACAPPLPDKFGELPLVMVTRTGGRRTSRATDQHRISVDVRAKTYEDAVAYANELCGAVESLEMEDLGGAFCHSSEITTLPYINVDPSHRDVPRATFAAQLVTGVILD